MSPSTPTSFDYTKDQIATLLQKSPTNHSSSETLALIRDNFRCLFTKAYDLFALQAHQALDPSLPDPDELLDTELTYILSQWMDRHTLEVNKEQNPENSTFYKARLCSTDTKYITKSLYIRDPNPKVQFQTEDEINLPLPDRTFLALHATCAKVTHLSGVGEYIENTFGATETVKMLAGDGASAEMLAAALNHATGILGENKDCVSDNAGTVEGM
ncbi:hypothetical protein EWM64_g10167 [Hericium alpestre]|uniref:HNH nuclease domain-containing protein n=1 Tax=Hericium alpestre TaxID=135208 RepID=A0A4Y9ZGH5_9AGAM|nr:hypothetical protein EWM64_g10167 [Hericium alpestre]